MKPEDWASLQVGASAELPSSGVLWAQPGPAQAGGPLTAGQQHNSLAHPHEHMHTHWGTRRSPYTPALLPVTNVQKLVLVCEPPFTLMSGNIYGAHTLSDTYLCTLPECSHTHTCSAIHVNHSYIHTVACAACYTHSRALITPTDTLHTHVQLVHVCVTILRDPVHSPVR